jgi:hypothetical protein
MREMQNEKKSFHEKKIRKQQPIFSESIFINITTMNQSEMDIH